MLLSLKKMIQELKIKSRRMELQKVGRKLMTLVFSVLLRLGQYSLTSGSSLFLSTIKSNHGKHTLHSACSGSFLQWLLLLTCAGEPRSRERKRKDSESLIVSSPKMRRKTCKRVKLKDLLMSVKGKTTKQLISTIVFYLLKKARELMIRKYNRSNKRCKTSFSENSGQPKFLLLTKMN